MEVTLEAVAGLDVHKKSVVACVFTPGPKGTWRKQLRTFGTMTQDLLALAAWLTQLGVTHVAMESTGEFWKPVYNLLEASFTVLIVNASTSSTFPAARLTSEMRSGSPSCCAMACSKLALFRPCRSGTCATSPASARTWCRTGRA